MSDVNKLNVDRSYSYAGSVGNASTQVFDQSAPLAVVGDVVYLQKISHGTLIKDVKVSLESAAGAATSIMKVGYIMDGVTVDDYFIPSVAMDAVGEKVSASMPLKADKDCYIIGTIDTADVTIADVRMVVQTNLNHVGEITA